MTYKCAAAEGGQTLLRLAGHSSVAFSPDGTFLASPSANEFVSLWDTVTGKALQTFKGHSATVAGVAVSRDGLNVASASYDQTVMVWDVKSGASGSGSEDTRSKSRL